MRAVGRGRFLYGTPTLYPVARPSSLSLALYLSFPSFLSISFLSARKPFVAIGLSSRGRRVFRVNPDASPARCVSFCSTDAIEMHLCPVVQRNQNGAWACARPVFSSSRTLSTLPRLVCARHEREEKKTRSRQKNEPVCERVRPRRQTEAEVSQVRRPRSRTIADRFFFPHVVVIVVIIGFLEFL